MLRISNRTVMMLAFVSTALIFWSGLASASGSQNGRITFTSNRSGSWQIYTMNPDGSDQIQVTNLAAVTDDTRSAFPSLSPDGRQIAFSYNASNGFDLYVINTDGSSLRQLTSDHVSAFPRWSPDGKRLAFATVSKLGTSVIATMPADGSGKRKILTTDLWDSVLPMYTPDGMRIVFQSSIGGYVSTVRIMNADGSNQRQLTPAALKGSPFDVSPDGESILLTGNWNSPPALSNDVYAMKVDGSELKHLAPLSTFHHDLYPSYSPDGTKVAFVSDRFAKNVTDFTYGTFDIVTMNADGSNLSDVGLGVGFCPDDGNCVDALWGRSPSGRLDSAEVRGAGPSTGAAIEPGSILDVSAPPSEDRPSYYLPWGELVPTSFGVRGLCNVDSRNKLTGGCVGSMSLHCVAKSNPVSCPAGQQAIRPQSVQMCVYGRPYVDAARGCTVF